MLIQEHVTLGKIRFCSMDECSAALPAVLCSREERSPGILCVFETWRHPVIEKQIYKMLWLRYVETKDLVKINCKLMSVKSLLHNKSQQMICCLYQNVKTFQVFSSWGHLVSTMWHKQVHTHPMGLHALFPDIMFSIALHLNLTKNFILYTIYKLVSSWGPKNVPTRISDIVIFVGIFYLHNIGFTRTTHTRHPN